MGSIGVYWRGVLLLGAEGGVGGSASDLLFDVDALLEAEGADFVEDVGLAIMSAGHGHPLKFLEYIKSLFVDEQFVDIDVLQVAFE